MGKRLFTTVRRVIVQAGGGVIFKVRAGTRQLMVATKNAFPAAAGTVHRIYKTLQSQLRAGTSHTVQALGQSQLDHACGTVHGIVVAPEPTVQRSAAAMTLLTLTNTTGYDPETAEGYAVAGDNDWQNVVNFVGRGESEAALTGGKGVGSLEEKGGGLRGNFYSPNAGKDGQVITSVELRVYLRQTGTLSGNGTLTWRLAGPISQALGSETGNVDQEYVYDLTSQVAGDWNNLRSLSIEVEGSSALLGRSCYARRAYITVVSNRTINLEEGA